MERLRKEWRGRSATGVFHDAPGFAAEGLVLGAGTVLAKTESAAAASSFESGDARLAALLAVAYGRLVSREAMGHLKASIRRWGDGDEARASLHLALSRLGRLNQPSEAARRLFMADGMMQDGVAPEAILDALDFDEPTNERAAKYSPDQPRVPAGNGRASGEWTTGDGGSAAMAVPHGSDKRPAQPHANGHPPVHPQNPRPRPSSASRADGSVHVSPGQGHARPGLTSASIAIPAAGAEAGLDLGGMSAAALGRLATFLTGLGEGATLATGIAATGTIAALGVLFIPNTEPKGRWIKVGGPGNVSYFHNPDETAVAFRYTTADGAQRTFSALQGPDGNYRGPYGRVVARWVKAAGKVALLVSTAALMGYDTDEPNLCPAPINDRPGGVRGRDYEDFGKAFFNPGNPTPRGMGYGFLNPTTGNEVVIDDCQRRTGILGEYKGPGFEKHFLKQDKVWDGMLKGMLEQAHSQVDAKGDNPLVWFFAERQVSKEMRRLFKEDGLDIRVRWLPWQRSSK